MESIKRYRTFGVNNKSVLYLTCYATMTVASIFFGNRHKSFVVPENDTDISLGEINGEQFHFNLNNGMNDVYGHHSNGKVRLLSRDEQNAVLTILLKNTI